MLQNMYVTTGLSVLIQGIISLLETTSCDNDHSTVFTNIISIHLILFCILLLLLSPRFFKKASGILQSPPSVRLSVTLSSPKPLDEIQPNLVCVLLT